MAYFSNGTEGQIYQEMYCSKCIHDENNDCPVWLAHLLNNYDDCNKPESVLNILIPQDGPHAGKCKMFLDKDLCLGAKGYLKTIDKLSRRVAELESKHFELEATK